jgi:Asp-tRNA(Asn)/Glu-tRNA(Gln) amidotransferase A subunit family amidase
MAYVDDMTDLIVDDATLNAAELLFGVRYTEAERAQMRDNLAGQIELAVQRRAVKLPNALPPATLFDPRLPGFSMPTQSAMNVPPVAPHLPSADEDIAFAPVRHLSVWIAGGQLSSLRLTRIYLDRIRRYDPLLLSFATVTDTTALAQAERADALLAAGTWLGPLHGLPYGAKDILDTAGITTGWGAEPFARRVPESDAEVIRRLAGAGAVLLGKTSVGALAYGDIWYGGRTRNPWNPEEGSRGSSAGSAAATAAGLAAFAIGTETLGSIVAPCARCGVTGLRPTFGRVSRAGAMALCWSLDKIGPICRAVDDVALVLAVINGFDGRDDASIEAPFGWDATRLATGLRVGYVAADFTDPLDLAVLDTVRAVGATAVPLVLPDLPYDALRHLLFAEAAAAFEELTLTDSDDTLTRQDPGAWPNCFRKARFLSAVDHIQLDRLRRRVMQEMDVLFQHVDVLLAPAINGSMTLIGNMTGHPCLTIRAGLGESRTRDMPAFLDAKIIEMDGPMYTVPHAITMVAPLFDEAAALTLGRALEGARDVAHRRPNLTRRLGIPATGAA